MEEMIKTKTGVEGLGHVRNGECSVTLHIKTINVNYSAAMYLDYNKNFKKQAAVIVQWIGLLP